MPALEERVEPHSEEVTQLQRAKDPACRDVSRFRNKAEGTPSRIKRRNSYMRLRLRTTDIKLEYPADVEEEKLSELPEETIEEVLRVASVNVGAARLNESLAMIIVANLRSLVTLEHPCDEEIDYRNDSAFRPVNVLKDVQMA